MLYKQHFVLFWSSLKSNCVHCINVNLQLQLKLRSCLKCFKYNQIRCTSHLNIGYNLTKELKLVKWFGFSCYFESDLVNESKPVDSFMHRTKRFIYRSDSAVLSGSVKWFNISLTHWTENLLVLINFIIA